MIIIADSGSSKTDWRLVSKSGSLASVQTIGLNAVLNSKEDFVKVLSVANLATWTTMGARSIYFYGAGVLNAKTRKTVEANLATFFGELQTNVSSDLVGAAKAAYGHEKGVVGILGTGSNSGYYDGRNIIRTTAPLGFILGDEGSGSAIGKAFIVQFLRNELPIAIADSFKIYYPDYQNLLQNIYNNPMPGRVLASIMPFIHKHIDNETISGLVRGEANKFMKIVEAYGEQDLALIGSIAFYFRPILQEMAENSGIKLLKVIKSPIDALTLYHQQELA